MSLQKLIAKPLTPSDQQKLIEDKLTWILSVARPLRIILIGSGARGELTEASDIDLVLVFRTNAELKDSRAAIYKARPKDDWPHDLLFYSKDSFELSAAKGGGVAYLAKLEGRILYDQESYNEPT